MNFSSLIFFFYFLLISLQPREALANCDKVLQKTPLVAKEDHMDIIKEFKLFGSSESKYTIILIPGGPGLGPEYMIPFAQQLAKDHQVVLMRTGYSCCGERINLARLSQELDLILKKFSERSEVILLAHSGGASIALDYLKLNIKVKTILVSWIYDMSWIKLYYEKNKEAPSRIALLEEMNALTSDPKEGLKNRMLAFAKDYFQNPERSAAKEIFEINGYYPEIASPIEEELKSGLSFSESLANAPQPILSIVGKNDRVIFPEYYDYLPEGIRNKIEMVTLDDSGHFPFIDQPQQLKNLVNKFILSFEQ